MTRALHTLQGALIALVLGKLAGLALSWWVALLPLLLMVTIWITLAVLAASFAKQATKARR